MSVLSRWHPVLRGWGFQPDTYFHAMLIDSERRVRWLEGGTSNSFNAAVEALCLLNRLASVDSEAWRREVNEIWGGHRQDAVCQWLQWERHDSVVEERIHPWRFGLSLLLRGNGVDPSRNIDHPTSEFVKLWRRFEAQSPGSTSPKTVLLRCHIKTQAALNRTLSLVEKQRQTTPPTGLLSICVVIDTVNMIRSSVCWPPTPDMLDTIHQLAEHGVRMVELPIVKLKTRGRSKTNDTAANSRAIVHGLRTLLKLPTVAASDGSISSVAYASVNTRCSQFIPACLSAIQEASSIRSLRVSVHALPGMLTEEARLQNYRLLAFTIFSEYANHSISSLTLDANGLDAIAYDEIARVLAHPDPLQAVYQVPQETRDAFPKQITATTFYLFDQTLSEEDQKCNGINHHKARMCYCSEQMIAVYVIEGPLDEKKPWWRVLLPGWGPAWVHQDSGMSSVDDGLLTRRSSRPRFRSISLERISRLSGDSTLDLLRLIGQYTERVQVTPVDNHLGHWYQQVAAVCPRLVAFEVVATRLSIASLQPFVVAAESGEGKMKKLALQSVKPATIEDIEAFFSALCEPAHPLTTHLQELSMTLTLSSAMVPTVAQLLQRLLYANRTLYMINIVVCAPRDDGRREPEVDSINTLVHEPVYVLGAPLESRKKLALLSAMSRGDSASCLQRLDSNVVATIFQFASRAVMQQASIIGRHQNW